MGGCAKMKSDLVKKQILPKGTNAKIADKSAIKSHPSPRLLQKISLISSMAEIK
jgi:hypothetical protein